MVPLGKKIKEKELIEEVLQPRSVAVNHAGLWILRRQFESARGYFPFPISTRLSRLHSSHEFIQSMGLDFLS